MKDTILVAYATKYGSTREVAEAVAEALKDSGAAVDLLPAAEVKSLDKYGAVVLGAPLFIMRWHKDAKNFLNRHRPALEKMPVCVFALGPTNDKEEDWQEVRGEIAKELAKFAWLKPAAVEVFGGRFDPNALGFPWNMLPAMKNMPFSDIRDWEKIRAWAAGIRPLLLPGNNGKAA